MVCFNKQKMEAKDIAKHIALKVDPQVSIDVSDIDPFANARLLETTGLTYTFEYGVTGSEEQGVPRQVDITGVDLADNNSAAIEPITSATARHDTTSVHVWARERFVDVAGVGSAGSASDAAGDPGDTRSDS